MSLKSLPINLMNTIRDKLAEPEADTACKMIDEMPIRADSVLNVRQAKSQLTKVLSRVRAGKPQFFKREGDDLPILVISLDTLAQVTNRAVKTFAFYETMRRRLKPAGELLGVLEVESSEVFELPELRRDAVENAI